MRRIQCQIFTRAYPIPNGTAKYHVVFVPKRRRKAIFGQTRHQLGPIFHALARQKECQIVEGHLMPDHVHMCIEIPPKHPVASVIGFLKGKSAIAVARLFGKERNFTASISGLAVMPCPQLASNWSKSANTSANKRARMEQAGRSELLTKARLSATPKPIANRL
jgi:REP element-mobilizing transposase RayT